MPAVRTTCTRVGVSHAYESTLAISFEVRGGLFVRQLHNWASSLFLASLLASLTSRRSSAAGTAVHAARSGW